MKKFILTLVLISGFIASAFADIPPPAGMKMSDQISGSAARILYESIGGTEVTFSENIGELKYEGLPQSFTQGRVRFTETKRSTTEIACATFYFRGRKGICKLVETYK